MGFFDFIRGGSKEEAEQKPAEPVNIGRVELLKVHAAVERLLTESISGEVKAAKKIYENMMENFGELDRLNRELNQKKFKSGQTRLDAPVNMIKDNYARKSLSLIGGIPSIQAFNYGEINSFSSEIGKIIKDMRNVPAKQVVLLSKYFKDESSRIVKKLKEIEDSKKQMESILGGRALWGLQEINRRVGSITDMQNRIRSLEGEEASLRNKIAVKRKEIDKKEKEIEDFLASEDFRNYGKIRKDLEKLDIEWIDVENELRDEISGLKRPFKKLEYTVKHDKAMDRERVKALSKISHSPMKALFQENGDSLLTDALMKLRDLNLKEEERIRVEELIKKVELGYITKLREKYEWLEKEVKSRKRDRDRSDIPGRLDKLKRESENLHREISEAERDLEKISESVKNDVKDIEKEKKNLEETLLKEINIRLDIII